jgi:hypothetical protein
VQGTHGNAQLLYELTFCIWTLSFHEQARLADRGQALRQGIGLIWVLPPVALWQLKSDFLANGTVPVLAEQVRRSTKAAGPEAAYPPGCYPRPC